MLPRAYTEDLILGKRYIYSNPYHPEMEYEDMWYIGKTYNKWGEECYAFSDKEIELPENYDGNAANLFWGGMILTESEIANGTVALPE